MGWLSVKVRIKLQLVIGNLIRNLLRVVFSLFDGDPESSSG